MKLLPAQRRPGRRPRDEHEHGEHEHGHDHADAGGIEWEDDMVEVNKLTTPANMRWKLVDRSTTPRTTTSTGSSASATA